MEQKSITGITGYGRTPPIRDRLELAELFDCRR
jgi:hypothetical protein